MNDKDMKGTPPSKEKREDSKIAITFISLIIIVMVLMLIYFIMAY